MIKKFVGGVHMQKLKSNRKKIIVVVGSLILLLFVFFIVLLPHTHRSVKSTSKNVEFLTEGNNIVSVSIHGSFPYGNIISSLDEHSSYNDSGMLIEKTYDYSFASNYSLLLGTDLKIEIKTSSSIIYTYILNFADRQIVISNGKVVE